MIKVLSADEANEAKKAHRAAFEKAVRDANEYVPEGYLDKWWPIDQ